MAVSKKPRPSAELPDLFRTGTVAIDPNDVAELVESQIELSAHVCATGEECTVSVLGTAVQLKSGGVTVVGATKADTAARLGLPD